MLNMRKFLNPAKFGEYSGEEYTSLPEYYFTPFWNEINLELSTDSYGSNDFHGRFHPSIIEVTLRRFTKPGEVVWDTFAGSGTTIDVSKAFGRRCIATDLHPTRSDIIQADSATFDPGKVHCVIMHPPYMGIVNYNSPMSSTTSVDEFVALFGEVFDNVNRHLEGSRVVCVVIGEVYVNSEMVPLDCHIHQLISKDYHYRMLGRVVKDYGRDTKGGAFTGKKFNNLWNYRILKYGIFRYGIETVMWFQKPMEKL